jgi:signal transduction histidine kinase
MIQVMQDDVTAASWPVIEMNGSGKALLGEWGASEETGKPFCGKAPPWAGLIIAQKLSISAFTNTSITHRFASADRLVCYVLTSVLVVEPDGSVRQLILRLRDISDREQKDVAFERAIFRAEEASRAKSAILANTSHELRTPLNAIIGYSELMQLGIGGALNGQQNEYVNIVHRSGKHLLAVISDILDLAKIEAGRFELHEEPVDLKAMAEDCLALVKVRAQGKPIRLYADIAELPALRADPLRLKQVLVNLLSNAVKFTEKGEVSLKAEETEAGGVSLIVSDTGIGMTDEEVALALQPFRQADSGRAVSDEGTGLGLPIAKNLTRLHGGTFLVHSAKGVGTKVILTFGPERLVKVEAALVERCA